jgi:hypothetical protein
MEQESRPVGAEGKTAKRAQYFEIFRRAAESVLEGDEAELLWLLREFNLPLCYSTALYVVLKQGRWRDAKNPQAYIKTAAKREALKADKPASKEIPLVSMTAPVDYLHKKSGGGITTHKIGGARIYDVCDHEGPTDSEGRELPTFKGKAVPEYLCSLEDDEPDACLVIDWQKVYARAGVDEYEQRILSLRSKGWTAQKIFDSATSDRENRELQNAYRRVDDGPLKSRITKALEASE